MQEKPGKTAKFVRILKLVGDDSAAVFPYLFAFYLVSLFVSIFSAVWRGYFYWLAFHFGVVLFALLSLGSGKVSVLWREVAEASKRGREKSGAVVGRTSLTFRKLLANIFVVVFIPMWKKVIFWKRRMKTVDYIKLAVILIILVFSLVLNIGVLEFFILLFGSVSVLFRLDMRLSAALALALLVLTPLLLAFNANVFAEMAAVYAYYFLVIAVITQIGEYFHISKDSHCT